MPVTSHPIGQPGPRRPTLPSGTDTALFFGRVGVLLVVVCAGGIIWAINGGFSVIGLGVVARSFNEHGALFWALVSKWTFRVPVDAPGLPVMQPVVPWVFVIAASLVQVSAAYLALCKIKVPLWLIIAAVALSVYDLGTTFFGLRTVAWVRQAGDGVGGIITTLLVFSVELSTGFILKALRR